MFHRRRYSVERVDTAEELATRLTEFTWCCCAGFEHAGFLYLNDATSEDGAQEYGVVRIIEDGRDWSGAGAVVGTQVESVTFSWCSEERALEVVREIESGRWGIELPVQIEVDDPRRHLCRLLILTINGGVFSN